MTDWIMIAITAIYVIATIAICYFNFQSSKAAKEQTEAMQQEYQQLHRPRVIVSFKIIRSGLMCFIIENVGTQPAFNVQIRVNDDFLENLKKFGDRLHVEELFSSSIYLAPGQQLAAFLESQLHFDDISKVVAVLKIEYNDKYSETIEIDIQQYAWSLVYTSPTEDISQHIKKIKEQQKSQNSATEKSIKHIAKSLGSLVELANAKTQAPIDPYILDAESDTLPYSAIEEQNKG